MTTHSVDMITKKIKLDNTQKTSYHNGPELIYKNMIVNYSDSVRQDKEIAQNWSSLFLEEIAKEYKELELLSLIEFDLNNRKFESKRLNINDGNVFNHNKFILPKNIKFNYPLEPKQSKELVEILFNYLYKNDIQENNYDTKSVEIVYNEIDSYTKSLLKNFLLEFQNRDLVKNESLEELAFEAYPSILFATHNEYLIALAIKPNNTHEIDSKVLELDKVFNISLAIYNSKKLKSKLNYESLSNYFNSFSLFLYKEKLDRNIKDSIGEASDIARYWYTDGLRRLNSMQEVFNKSTNSFEFSTAFVQEILSADIEGVQNIEVYPFDRCFIFSNSALDNMGNQRSQIVVSEAKLKQKSISDEPIIKDRGNMLYEWERYHKDIQDYDIDFSNKDVEFKDFFIRETTDGKQKTLVVDDKYESIINNLNSTTKDFKQNDEKAVDFMIYNLLTNKAEPKDILDLEKKYFDNDDGLCYTYSNGVNLENMPVLKSLQESYWKNIAKLKQEENQLPEGFDFDTFIQNVDTENTKVVFISYDPSRAKSESKVEIDKKHAFSMLIIANWDVPKTISEISAEKEDLDTALKLIVRQKTERAELIKQEREDQKKFITMQLGRALHAIKGSVKNSKIKDDIDAVYKKFKEKLEDDKQELIDRDIISSCKDTRLNELFKVIIDDNFRLEKPETLWDEIAKNILTKKHIKQQLSIDGETINFHFMESFLPNIRVRLDRITVQETFHVMLKNAVEATLGIKDIKKHNITVFVNTYYKNSQSGLLNFYIINDTNPISETRINAMNTAIEDIEKNPEKEGSTGAGIASSRNQLQSRFGEDANIHFKMLTPTKIKSILSIPIEFLESKEFYKQEDNDIHLDDDINLLYLEDEEQYFKPSINYLNKHNISYKHSTSKNSFNQIWSLSNILITDINIYNNSKKGRYGVNAVKDFKNNQPNGTVFILTNESKDELEKDLIKQGINKEKIIYVIDKDIKQGAIYILSEKSIVDICNHYPQVLKFISHKEIENTDELTASNELITTHNIDSVDEITKEFLKLHLYYLHQPIAYKEIESVYKKWDMLEYYHEDEEIEDYISNPDVFDNKLIVPIILGNKKTIDINKLILFGFKNNIIFVLLKNKKDFKIESINHLLLQLNDIHMTKTGIFSAMNHDLLNIEDEQILEITSQIPKLNIYHDAKNLTVEQIFKKSEDESNKIKALYQEFSRILENNQVLLLELNNLQNSLKYFIDVSDFNKEVLS